MSITKGIDGKEKINYTERETGILYIHDAVKNIRDEIKDLLSEMSVEDVKAKILYGDDSYNPVSMNAGNCIVVYWDKISQIGEPMDGSTRYNASVLIDGIFNSASEFVSRNRGSEIFETLTYYFSKRPNVLSRALNPYGIKILDSPGCEFYADTGVFGQSLYRINLILDYSVKFTGSIDINKPVCVIWKSLNANNVHVEDQAIGEAGCDEESEP